MGPKVHHRRARGSTHDLLEGVDFRLVMQRYSVITSVKLLTTHTFERASNSALTKKPPIFESISSPADLASSTLGSNPTATTTWSTDNWITKICVHSQLGVVKKFPIFENIDNFYEMYNGRGDITSSPLFSFSLICLLLSSCRQPVTRVLGKTCTPSGKLSRKKLIFFNNINFFLKNTDLRGENTSILIKCIYCTFLYFICRPFT